jgi:hypothetical protein
MDKIRDTTGAQILGQQRGAARTIDIVIAEDRDRFGADHRLGQACGGGFHIRQHMGIRHQIPQARIEEALRVVKSDPSPGKNACEHIREAMGLRDGERDGTLRGGAAFDPGAAEGGAGYAQERTGQMKRC